MDGIEVKSGFKLAKLDLDQRLPDKAYYERALDAAQTGMLEVQQAYKVANLRGIVMFEGWDGGRQGRRDPASDRAPRSALATGLGDRRAKPGRTGPSLSVALLGEAAAPGSYRHLRPQLVWPRAGRACRAVHPQEGLATRLPRNQ
jgi:hypothetical protein